MLIKQRKTNHRLLQWNMSSAIVEGASQIMHRINIADMVQHAIKKFGNYIKKNGQVKISI